MLGEFRWHLKATYTKKDLFMSNNQGNGGTASRLVLAILALGVTFIIADTLVRIAARKAGGVSPETTLLQNDPDIGAVVHVPNSSAITHWRGTAPHPVSFNAFGFRGPFPLTLEKPEGVIRILTLGGSSTEGGFVADGKTWPEVLQRALDKTVGGGKVEVINLGTSGYSTKTSLANFKKRGLPLKPDMVILYEANNDFFGYIQSYLKSELSTDESFIDYESRKASRLEKILCKSIIIDRINRHLYSRGGKRNQVYLREYWSDPNKTLLNLTGVEIPTVHALQEFEELAKLHGFKLVIGRQATLIKPEISEKELYAMWEILRMRHGGKRLAWSVIMDGLNRVKDAQKQFAKDNGLTYVDVESVVPKDLEHFIDHVHYSERGEESVGKAWAVNLIKSERELLRIAPRLDGEPTGKAITPASNR